MYSPQEIQQLLFIDIETVHTHRRYEDLPEGMQACWRKRVRRRLEDGGDPAELYLQEASIPAEFSKVICISCARFMALEEGPRIVVKSYAREDEAALLSDFVNVIESHFHGSARLQSHGFCGHNIREFDIPFICRRLVINGLLPFPAALQIQGKRPWEVRHFVDTMELWKFGDYKNFTSLDTLTHILDIPSPKQEIDGSQVAHVYWEERDLPRIVRYCEADVVTTVQVMLRFAGLPIVDPEGIESLTEAIPAMGG